MSITLDEAKDQLDRGIAKGVRCLCCDRYTKLYKRKLNSGMARFLVYLYRMSGEGQPWVHALDVFKTMSARYQGDYAKLRFWGFIETTQPDTDSATPESGLWRITDTGKSFVRGHLEVPQCATTRNNTFLGFVGKSINVQDALGNNFDLNELLSV